MNDIMDSVKVLDDSLYVKLTDTLLRAVESGSITKEKSKELSSYILLKGGYIRTSNQLTSFLKRLSEKWDQYNPFYVQAKYTSQKVEEQVKIEEIQAKLGQYIQKSYGTSTTN